MKWSNVLIVLCVGSLAAFGEITEKEMKKLQRIVRINSVQSLTKRDEERNKTEILQFFTTQDERAANGYSIRIAVEVTDKDRQTYYAQLMRTQGSLDAEYIGEDLWELHIPHGEMQRPKISAYVIEYGLMDGGQFVPIAVDRDDVDSVEELVQRAETCIDDQVKLKHAYRYREFGGNDISVSNFKTLRK